MKKIAKIIVAALFIGFVGWCVSTGNAAEERREAIILQQQEHDLQQAHMSRVQAEEIHE